MKLFIALLLIVGGYYAGLMAMQSLALNQLSTIQGQYSAVSAAADQWQQGNTSVPLTGTR